MKNVLRWSGEFESMNTTAVLAILRAREDQIEASMREHKTELSRIRLLHILARQLQEAGYLE